jgi:hypothetical protein
LGDILNGFLQALLPKFTLPKENKGQLLDSSIKNDLLTVRNGAGKKQFFKTLKASPKGKEQLKKDLDYFQEHTESFSYRFGRTENPMRYRSANQSIVQWLHDYLKESGLKLFFSAENVPFLGGSDYAAAIDAALESAKRMVVLGTSPECFDSGWVGYEWRSFLNEKLSGRKKDSRLFTFVSGVVAHELPFALRSVQMIPFSVNSPQDSFETPLRFLDRPQEEIVALDQAGE